MSDFKDIQDLIRLKRHEQPSPEFVDQFVKSFQQRQRAELLNQSARGLLWERVTTYFDGLMAPKWGWAAATAMALAGTFAILQGSAPQAPGSALVQGKSGVEAGRMAPISDEEYKQYLLGDHYKGGFGDEREFGPQTHPSDSVSRAHGGVLPVGFKLDLQQ